MRARIVCQQFEAVHVGQAEIEDDEIGLVLEQLQRGLAVGRVENVVALGGEPHAQQLADRRLVVDDQDLERCGAHAAVSSCLAPPPGSAGGW